MAIPPAAQRIDMAWEAPEIRSMLEQLGSFSRYLHFDQRSTGASERRSRVPGSIDGRRTSERSWTTLASESRHMTRAVLGSVFGSFSTLLLLVAGPQEIQSSVVTGTSSWPTAVALSALAGCVAGFLGNRQKPRRWPAFWIAGCLVGALLVVVFVAVFGTTGDWHGGS